MAINLLGVMINHPEVYQAFYEQVIAPRFQQGAQVIKLAQAGGEIRQDLDAHEIIGLLDGLVWSHLFVRLYVIVTGKKFIVANKRQKRGEGNGRRTSCQVASPAQCERQRPLSQ